MKILVAAPRETFARIEPVVVAMLARGHRVQIANGEGFDPDALPAAWRRGRGVAIVECPHERGDRWQADLGLLRALGDYAECLCHTGDADPPSSGCSTREIVAAVGGSGTSAEAAFCPSCAAALSADDVGRFTRAAGDAALANLAELARLAEQAVPAAEPFTAFLTGERPDAVFAPPASGATWQAEVVRSAATLGIPVVRSSGAADAVADDIERVHARRQPLSRWWPASLKR